MIDLTTISTIPEMFLAVCNEYGDKEAYFYKEKGEWKGITFREVRHTVENIAYGLASLGCDKGDRVAILSNNNPKWAMSDYAVICMGGATASVYPTLTSPQVKFILDDCESKVVITENREQADKVLDFLDDSEFIKTVVVMDDDSYDRDNVIAFSELTQLGEDHNSSAGFDFEERARSAKADDLLTLIYTSGTTGNPKGVMLTHNNIVTNIKATYAVVTVESSDVYLSFLPLSHSYERTVGHFGMFSVGATVYYAESIEKVSENIPEVRPSVMASVPRLYEKMYTRILDKVAGDPALRQKIFWWAIGVGREALKYRQKHEPMPAGLKIKHGIAEKLVFSKLKDRLGGRLKFFSSGAAPLSGEIGEFFGAAGLIILEGYGLTETSPVMTLNSLDSFKFGTVGHPISDVEVKIAEDGEILNRGPNTMKGYFKNEDATREAIDADGWFHTGDIGEFDEDGFLRITDRKKNLIVTSGGKNVAPAALENALITSKYIEQLLVIGDNRNFISALIVPSFEALEGFAADKGISETSPDALCRTSEVQALFDAEVAAAMENFARFERIRKVELLPKEWTIADNELTPTLKVKRRVVVERYKDVIDAMYAAPPPEE